MKYTYGLMERLNGKGSRGEKVVEALTWWTRCFYDDVIAGNGMDFTRLKDELAMIGTFFFLSFVNKSAK